MGARVASALASLAAALAVSCLDRNGQPVDYWFILKQNNALDYAYFDANSGPINGPLSLQGATLNDTRNPLGATMQAVNVAGPASLAILQWNDEVPEGAKTLSQADAAAASSASLRGGARAAQATSGTSGHTKGMIAADADGGFWLIHSVPLFNPIATGNFSWTTSITYGQSMMCLSLDAETLETAGTQLLHMDPLLFDSAIPSALAKTYPTLASVVAGTRSTGVSTHQLPTRHGVATFTHFAKTGSTGKDIMEDVIEPWYGDAAAPGGFYWETWRRTPVEATYCTPTYAYNAININMLQFGGANGPVQYKYTTDHSKWGIAVGGGDEIVCDGGMNRMTSQMTRGGGAACFVQPDLWAALKAMIVEADSC